MVNMKIKGVTLIEIITVLAIVILLSSLAGLAIKTISSSNNTFCSTALINSLLVMGKATAAKEGNYAGVYFYDQNGVLCVMDVVDRNEYTLPYIQLYRVDGSQIKEIGSPGDVNEAVVLFSPSGRLVIKDVGIGTYRGYSNRILNINGKEYYINTYSGRLIDTD